MVNDIVVLMTSQMILTWSNTTTNFDASEFFLPKIERPGPHFIKRLTLRNHGFYATSGANDANFGS